MTEPIAGGGRHHLLPRAKAILDVVATLSIIVAAAAITWQVVTSSRPAMLAAPPTGPLEDISDRRLNVSSADIIGRSEPGTVVLIEFADFECPFCRRFSEETMPKLKDEYISLNKVGYLFRNLPLPIHSMARRAAGALECARAQGRFWNAYHWLFSEWAPSADKAFHMPLVTVGELCISEVDPIVDGHIAEAAELGVTSTPTFFLGRLRGDSTVTLERKISGAVPVSVFRAEIDRALSSSE